MKVDFNSGVTSQIGVERTAKQVSSSKVSNDQSATLATGTRSTLTHTVPSLVSRALSSPDVRQDRVNSLRDSIAAGTYTVDNVKIAGAILADDGN